MTRRHTQPPVPFRKLIPLALVLAAGMTGGAQAQEGVFVDPDSPSGKEYAVPLEAARRQADPKASKAQRVAPGRRDQAPLFGEGIDAGDPAAGAGRASGGTKASRRKRPRETRASPARKAAPATVRAAVSRPGAPDGGLGTTLMIAGGAAVVLLAGGLGGLALRRSRT